MSSTDNPQTNQEVLEKAIRKAIEGGWDLLPSKDSNWMWYVGEGRVNGLCVHTKPDIEKTGLITYFGNEYQYERIIYNHDFAKAIWGEELITCFECSEGGHTTDHGTNEPWTMFIWQYHLQQMVIAPNPIKYLGDNI